MDKPEAHEPPKTGLAKLRSLSYLTLHPHEGIMAMVIRTTLQKERQKKSESRLFSQGTGTCISEFGSIMCRYVHVHCTCMEIKALYSTYPACTLSRYCHYWSVNDLTTHTYSELRHAQSKHIIMALLGVVNRHSWWQHTICSTRGRWQVHGSWDGTVSPFPIVCQHLLTTTDAYISRFAWQFVLTDDRQTNWLLYPLQMHVE